MAPYATTAFGRKALASMRGGKPKRSGGGGGRSTKTIPTPTISSILTAMYGEMLTPKQQRKQARSDVNTAIQDSLRTLRTTQQRQLEEVYRARYANDMAQQYLSSSAAGDPAAARAAWQSAGAQSGAINQGLVNSVEGAQQTAAEGASTIAGAMGQDTAILPGGAAANAAVGQHLGVTLPAPVFGARGESAFAATNLSREQAMAKFRDLAPGYENQLMEIRDKYTQAVTDVLSKRPTLMREALSGIDESRRQNYSTILSALGLQNTALGTQADIVNAQAKLVQDQQELTERIRHQRETEQQGRDRVAVQQMNAQTSRMNAQTSKGRLAVSRAAQGGDLTEAESNYREEAKKYVREILAIDKKGRARSAFKPPKAALAAKIFAVYGAPLVGKWGLTREMMLQWAQEVVNTFPDRYWKTGGGGGGGGGGNSGNLTTVDED